MGYCKKVYAYRIDLDGNGSAAKKSWKCNGKTTINRDTARVSQWAKKKRAEHWKTFTVAEEPNDGGLWINAHEHRYERTNTRAHTNGRMCTNANSVTYCSNNAAELNWRVYLRECVSVSMLGCVCVCMCMYITLLYASRSMRDRVAHVCIQLVFMSSQ